MVACKDPKIDSAKSEAELGELGRKIARAARVFGLASDAADLWSAFNLRAASQHPERASPEEALLETHLTVGVVCQATVDLRGAQARTAVERDG